MPITVENIGGAGLKFELIGAINHVPDIERELDWQTPARDQVLQLIHDPELARPQEFGTMKAAEKPDWTETIWP